MVEVVPVEKRPPVVPQDQLSQTQSSGNPGDDAVARVAPGVEVAGENDRPSMIAQRIRERSELGAIGVGR